MIKCPKTGIWDLFFQFLRKVQNSMSELYGNYIAECSIQNCSHNIGQKAKPVLSRGFWGEYLYEFCTGRSTTEQIFILRHSLEKHYKMALISTGFLLIINRLLKVLIDIIYTCHLRAMTFQTSLAI
jgi:hypothetical protein